MCIYVKTDVGRSFSKNEKCENVFFRKISNKRNNVF